VFRTRDGVLAKFFADRGTHLAAMIAYFALLAFVPLTFLALSLLGLTGRADESSFLVTEIKRALPDTRIEDIVRLVRSVQDNAASLGLVGAAFLLWTALSLFSALESAFNIVYGQPNRAFLHGKLLAVLLMLGSFVTLFVGLLAGSFGVQALRRYAPGFIDNDLIAYSLSIAVSAVAMFVFLVSIYYLLTNVRLELREVLVGAAFATVLLEASFQALPVFVRYAQLNPALKTFGSPVILLVWLYVMANVIVLGAEINWWRHRRKQEEAADEELPGLA
jgi:membrane protein